MHQETDSIPDSKNPVVENDKSALFCAVMKETGEGQPASLRSKTHLALDITNFPTSEQLLNAINKGDVSSSSKILNPDLYRSNLDAGSAKVPDSLKIPRTAPGSVSTRVETEPLKVPAPDPIPFSHKVETEPLKAPPPDAIPDSHKVPLPPIISTNLPEDMDSFPKTSFMEPNIWSELKLPNIYEKDDFPKAPTVMTLDEYVRGLSK